jgi:hypothetical protein
MTESPLHVEKTKAIGYSNISHRSADRLTCFTRFRTDFDTARQRDVMLSGMIPSLQAKEIR